MELKLGFLTSGAMRIVQVGIALSGVVLILAAIYDLASARAARLAAWLSAFEPASLFFNSALHKEPNYGARDRPGRLGGTMIWQRLDLRGGLLCGLGGLIADRDALLRGLVSGQCRGARALHAALRQPRSSSTRHAGDLRGAIVALPG